MPPTFFLWQHQLCTGILLVASIACHFHRHATAALTTAIGGVSHLCILIDPERHSNYRYCDWALVTLILTHKILEGHHIRGVMMAAYLVCDVLTITAGFLGETSRNRRERSLWFMFAVASYFPLCMVFYTISLTSPIGLVVLYLYTLYPVIWVMHDKAVLSKNVTESIYSTLDITCKIGISLML